jgi:beta-xylosidase
MTDKTTQAHAHESNMEKDPDQWVTGEEPMTGAQRSYLKTLSEEAKVSFDDRLTKAEASKRIDELQAKTGRGKPQPNDSEPGSHVTPDPTGNPASLAEKQQRPKGAPRIE